MADGFKEGESFDVADRAADFDDGDVGSGVFGLILGEAEDGVFDFIGDVGDHLHRSAEVVAVALLGNDLIVDGTRGRVVFLGERRIEIAFVVPQIEVRLRPIIRNVHFTVLIGVHGSGVHVDIGIKFLDGHGQPARFQQRADGSRRKPFAERGKDATSDEDKLGLHEKPRVMIFPP